MQLIHPAHQADFEKNGYTVIDLLSDTAIRSLQAIYDQYPAERVASFQVSNYEKNPVKNAEIDRRIKSVILEPISRHITGHKVMSGFFYVKFSGADSAFYIHKDWNVVDEQRYRSMHIWIPLEDTTSGNGNLFFCPYDYDRVPTFRGSPGFEHPEPGALTKLINRLWQKDIYTRAGQAICFDHRMTHGSRPNRSGHTRVAAGISLIPTEATPVHYHREDTGEIKTISIKEDFYIDFNLDSPE